MTKRFIGYLILVIALYLLINYSGYEALMQVFFFLLLLPFLSLIGLLIARYGLQIRFEMKQKHAVRLQPFDLDIHVYNPSFLPLSAIDIKLSHQAENESRRYPHPSIRLMLSPFSRERFPIQYHFEHRGIMNIRLKSVRLTDSCGFFRLPLSARKRQHYEEIEVWPRRLLLSDEADHHRAERDAELSRSTTVSQEYDEVARLRLYQAGDKLKRIHWSVSARMQDLYVRDFEDAREMETSIVLADAIVSSPHAQLLADTGAELVMRILAENLSHTLPTHLLLAGLSSIDVAQSLFLRTMEDLDYAASALAKQIPETGVEALREQQIDRLDRGIQTREDLSTLIEHELSSETQILYLLVYAVDERLISLISRLMKRLNKLYLLYIHVEEADLSQFRAALAAYNVVILPIDALAEQVNDAKGDRDEKGASL